MAAPKLALIFFLVLVTAGATTGVSTTVPTTETTTVPTTGTTTVPTTGTTTIPTTGTTTVPTTGTTTVPTTVTTTEPTTGTTTVPTTVTTTAPTTGTTTVPTTGTTTVPTTVTTTAPTTGTTTVPTTGTTTVPTTVTTTAPTTGTTTVPTTGPTTAAPTGTTTVPTTVTTTAPTTGTTTVPTTGPTTAAPTGTTTVPTTGPTTAAATGSTTTGTTGPSTAPTTVATTPGTTVATTAGPTTVAPVTTAAPGPTTQVTFRSLTGNSFVTTASLLETATTNTPLAFVACANSIPSCSSCQVKSVTDSLGNAINSVNSASFATYRFINDNGYRLFYTGNAAALQSNSLITRRFTVTVGCSQGGFNTLPEGTTTIVVDVVPNQAPVFSQTNSVSTLDASFDPSTIGASVFSVPVTDNDGDALTYSMTQETGQNYFTIGASDGVIRTRVDRRTIAEPSVTTVVTVSDGTTTTTGTVTISLAAANTRPFISNLPASINVTDDWVEETTPFFVSPPESSLVKPANTRPFISNLPASINVTEDTTTGMTLRTLTVGDFTPQGVTLTPECSVDPEQEAFKFSYETGTRRIVLNTITTGQVLLNHEETSKYLISCVVSDGYLSSQLDVLTVFVNNVNEPPVFNAQTYFCNLQESAAGVNQCDLDVTLTDPENDAIATVGLLSGNNSERFRYDRNTKRLTFNVDYDVDNNNMPTNVITTLFAVDSNRATGSAKIEINIADANDNLCDFGSSTAVQFPINQGTALGDLGSLTATDGDLTSPNNDITYERIAGFPSTALNYINVFGNGLVRYVGLIPESEHGRSFFVTVRCKDGGSPSRSATGTVQVTYLTTTSTSTSTSTTSTTTTTPTTTTVTTTTTAKSTLFDDEGFVAVFATLMALLGLGLLIALWYFCCRNGQFNTFFPQQQQQPPQQQYYRQRPRQPMTPPRRVHPADEYDNYDNYDDYDDYDPPTRGRDDRPRTYESYDRRGMSRDSYDGYDDYDDYDDYDRRPVTKSDIGYSMPSSRALPPVERTGYYY